MLALSYIQMTFNVYAIYNDTSSTNVCKWNIFDTDYFANLNVIIAGKNMWTSLSDLVNECMLFA